MKCKTCNTKLQTIKGVGTIHPPNDNCKEDDGIRISIKTRKEWEQTYPTNYSSQNIVYKTYIKGQQYLKRITSYFKQRKTQ